MEGHRGCGLYRGVANRTAALALEKVAVTVRASPIVAQTQRDPAASAVTAVRAS
jgi:hypothetical protein